METPKKRGFASFTPEQRKHYATMGGKATSANKAHMSEIGRKGGLKSATVRRKPAPESVQDSAQ